MAETLTSSHRKWILPSTNSEQLLVSLQHSSRRRLPSCDTKPFFYTGAHINNVKSTWKYILRRHSTHMTGGPDYILHVAECMFKITRTAQNIDPFCKYMNTISSISWNIEMEDKSDIPVYSRTFNRNNLDIYHKHCILLFSNYVSLHLCMLCYITVWQFFPLCVILHHIHSVHIFLFTHIYKTKWLSLWSAVYSYWIHVDNFPNSGMYICSKNLGARGGDMKQVPYQGPKNITCYSLYHHITESVKTLLLLFFLVKKQSCPLLFCLLLSYMKHICN